MGRLSDGALRAVTLIPVCRRWMDGGDGQVHQLLTANKTRPVCRPLVRAEEEQNLPERDAVNK